MRLPYKFTILFLAASIIIFSSKQDEREQDIAQKIRGVKNEKSEFLKKNGDLRIRQIILKGNKRTKTHVLSQWFANNEGKKLSELDIEKVMEDLFKLKILASIDVEYKVVPRNIREKTEKGVDIHIRVGEKWTLYPIPIFYAFQGTILGGLFIVESNLLGYNYGATAGGIYSNRGWQYIVGFASPYILTTDFFGEIRSAGGSIYTENKDARGTLHQAFQQQRYDILYTFGYTFWKIFSVANTGGVFLSDVPNDKNIHTDKKPILNVPGSANILYLGIKFFFNDRLNRFYYDKGLRSTLEFKKGFNLDKNRYNVYSIESQNKYTHESFYDHTVSLALYWAYSNFPETIEHRLGGNEASRTLPSLFIPADRYINLSLLYQIPIYEFKYGTFTLLNFFEGGLFNRNKEPLTYYYGPGLGIRFYFKYITIPAFGVDIAYELNAKDLKPKDRIRFSVAVGFRPTR